MLALPSRAPARFRVLGRKPNDASAASLAERIRGERVGVGRLLEERQRGNTRLFFIYRWSSGLGFRRGRFAQRNVRHQWQSRHRR